MSCVKRRTWYSKPLDLSISDSSKIRCYACAALQKGVRRDSNPHRPRSQPGVLLQLDYIHQSIYLDLNQGLPLYQSGALTWLSYRSRNSDLSEPIARSKINLTCAERRRVELLRPYGQTVFKTVAAAIYRLVSPNPCDGRRGTSHCTLWWGNTARALHYSPKA